MLRGSGRAEGFDRRVVALASMLALVIVVIGVSYGLTQASQQEDDESPQMSIVTLDDRLAATGHDVPGFGGVDWEDDGVYVYMMDTSQQEAAEQAARTLAQGRSISQVWTRQADYTMAQLASWYRPMYFAILGKIDGVQSTDLAEQKNRLHVGITSEEAQGPVEAELAELGIPREAVIIEVEPQIKSMSHGAEDEDNHGT